MMKLSISNIAWTSQEEVKIANLLQNYGIEGVEIAPSKIRKHPTQLTDTEIDNYKNFWSKHGIQIVAMQSLLFGAKGLALFETSEQRKDMLEYLKKIIRIGERLGAKALVFGSPQNRRVNNQEPKLVREIALDFFDKIGTFAAKHNTVFLLEPNAAIYNCDFIMTQQEAIKIAAEVNNPGFSFHVDSAALYLAKESPNVLQPVIDKIFHVHASEPYLKPISDCSGVQHTELAALLHNADYKGFVSIEMRNVSSEPSKSNSAPNLATVKNALEITKKLYFST